MHQRETVRELFHYANFPLQTVHAMKGEPRVNYDVFLGLQIKTLWNFLEKHKTLKRRKRKCLRLSPDYLSHERKAKKGLEI